MNTRISVNPSSVARVLGAAGAFLVLTSTAGQVIRYAVVALAADGRVVSLGGPIRVVLPGAPAAR